MVEVYQQSDLLVFPTRQDYMPQVVAGALSTGLPVMSTPVGDIPDLVRHRENGWLMPEDVTAEEWADAIRNLIDNLDELAGL
ncbi:MAG: glycosyltransferase [Bryobacterales bacterium]|nr:glycosyltransferase [Bryobacterales bacterium]